MIVTDLYHEVPKDREANLEYRAELLRKCDTDREFRAHINQACRLDPLFYINSFLFTCYPDPDEAVIPFITYSFQDAFIISLKEAFGKEDVFCCKSREMGASYCVLAAMDHSWRFVGDQSFLIGSRKEDLVDKRNDPSSLFGKLDFFDKYLPKWMVPDHTRNDLYKRNTENGSLFVGESANPNFARGGRYTAIMNDEFAHMPDDRDVEKATADATKCRVYISTPAGTANVFYEKHVNPHIRRKFYFHWSHHPDKAKRIYQGTPRSWEFYDKTEVRNPWYDNECKRRHPMEIAQELDNDFLGSSYQFFDSVLLDRVIKDNVVLPMAIGRLMSGMDGEPTGWMDSDQGECRLWLNLENGHPPYDLVYGVAADIAAGSIDKDGRGASISCASVGNLNTGEKVAELAVSGVMPHDFAKMVFTLGKWFGGQNGDDGAYVIWERNGPGQAFGRTLFDLGYRHVYYQENLKKLVGDNKLDQPGWWTTKDSKQELLDCYQRDLKLGLFLNRSRQAVEDCRLYVFDPAQGVCHATAANTDDPTGARANHADRVIADALLNHIMRKRQASVKVARKYEPGTVGFRWEQRMKKKQAARYLI